MLEDLKNRIAAQKVVIFVGTGVSWGASSTPLAGWKGFLEAGIAACEAVLGAVLPVRWGQRQLDALNEGDLDELLNVAEAVSRKLDAPRGGEFRRWLRETVGTLTVKDPGVIRALDALQVPLVTTNYDDLLEKVTSRKTITWRQDSHVNRFIDDRHSLDVLHIHGHWEDSESIVLGVRSYEYIIGHDHVQSTLRNFLMSRTALFIGYGDGLEDPNFSLLRQWATTVLRGTEHRHYRLCRASEAQKIARIHQGERIFPVIYGDTHNELEPFLRSLIPTASTLSSRKGSTRKVRESFGLMWDARYLESDLAGAGYYVLAVIDMNGLSNINNEEGHASGDMAIQTYLNSIVQAVDTRGACYRFGGDEVTVVFPEADIDEASSIMIKALAALGRDVSRPLTASCGIAKRNSSERTENVLSRARQAMVSAKRSSYGAIRRSMLCVDGMPVIDVLKVLDP